MNKQEAPKIHKISQKQREENFYIINPLKTARKTGFSPIHQRSYPTTYVLEDGEWKAKSENEK